MTKPSKSNSKGGRRWRRWLILILVLFVIGVAGGAYGLFARYISPGTLQNDTQLVIVPGTGVKGIAEMLESVGIIQYPLVFRIAARVYGAEKKLKAGEYLFPANVSIRTVIQILEGGETLVRRVTIPEGLTVKQIADVLQGADGLFETMPKALAEGSLLPETYHFSWGDTRREIVARMSRAMDEALAEEWKKRTPGLPLKTPAEAVVLAAIVEKETALAAERPMVAGVFINRLRKGMRLQSDPTVIYALSGGDGDLGRDLTRQDLKILSPYNTYQNAGLPPGPIANPGLASIKAVLNPASTDAFYFVADGNGGHVFSKTLAEHNKNVAKWRKIRDGKKTKN